MLSLPLPLLLLPLLLQRRAVLQSGHNMAISVEHSCLARMCDFAVRLLSNFNKQSLQLHPTESRETICQSISWSIDQCNPNQRWNYFNLLHVCFLFSPIFPLQAIGYLAQSFVILGWPLMSCARRRLYWICAPYQWTVTYTSRIRSGECSN